MTERHGRAACGGGRGLGQLFRANRHLVKAMRVRDPFRVMPQPLSVTSSLGRLS